MIESSSKCAVAEFTYSEEIIIEILYYVKSLSKQSSFGNDLKQKKATFLPTLLLLQIAMTTNPVVRLGSRFKIRSPTLESPSLLHSLRSLLVYRQ